MDHSLTIRKEPMTHVEELCLNLESAYLAIDREIGVVLRAALVADKVEAAKPPPQPRPSEGMSRAELRQWAAIHAPIDPMPVSVLKQDDIETVCRKRAIWAVAYADALVAELDREPTLATNQKRP